MGDSNEYIKYTKFNIKKENHPGSAVMRFFQGTQEQVRNSRDKRAIGVRATEVVLYLFWFVSGHWRGDSNEYIKYTKFNIKKKENNPKLSPICSCAKFSKGLKNEFETAVVYELSVFEPLKLYCICVGLFQVTGAMRFSRCVLRDDGLYLDSHL